MKYEEPEIEELIALLIKLPGFGPRSAGRAALKLLEDPAKKMLPLAKALENAARHIKKCSLCNAFTTQKICRICSDPYREQNIICVVESQSDLRAIERGRFYHGFYHVLGGILSAFYETGPEDLYPRQLLQRIETQTIDEVILALPATVDGSTTAHWLFDLLTPYKIKVTSLAQGVPIGGSIDLLDDGTLNAALKARRLL